MENGSLSVKVLLAEKRNIEVENLAKREWCCGASLSVESMLVEKRLASIHVRTCTSLRENDMAHISPLPSISIVNVLCMGDIYYKQLS